MYLPEPVIVDDVAPYRYADELEAQISTIRFPWYYSSDVGFFSDVSRFYNTTSEPFVNRDVYSLIYPLTFFLEDKTGVLIKNIVRVSLSCLTPHQQVTPSCAYRFDHMTAHYFINESSEGITIYNERREEEPFEDFDQGFINPPPESFTPHSTIDHQKNRLILLNGLQYSSIQAPSSDRKLVLTINFI